MPLILSAPVAPKHGDRFGDLKTLGRAPSKSGGHGMRYWAGCARGHRSRYTITSLKRGKCVICPEVKP